MTDSTPPEEEPLTSQMGHEEETERSEAANRKDVVSAEDREEQLARLGFVALNRGLKLGTSDIFFRQPPTSRRKLNELIEALEILQRTYIEESVSSVAGSDVGAGEQDGKVLRELASRVAVELREKHSLAECLRYLRDETGQRNADVIRGTGLDRSNLTRYIAGDSVPSRQTLTRILDFFAERAPEVREGALTRQYIFDLQAIALGQLPEDLRGPEYVEALARAFELVRSKAAVRAIR